ncbi:MAG: FtsW/RodA/SpoVE family cell cycle protein [Acidimicrobiales bacterium]
MSFAGSTSAPLPVADAYATGADRSRRRVELGLMALVGLLTASAYMLASLGRTASLPANLVPFLLAVLGLMAAAHVATRKLAPGADGLLLPLAALLNGIGYVFVARLDPTLAGFQALWTAIGVSAFVATLALLRRGRDLERYRYSLGAAGIVFLMLPLVPVIGQTINGSRLWLRVGPVSFQPGEAAKIALCIFFASYLVERRELLSAGTRKLGPLWLPEARHVAPIVAAWSVSLVIMLFERDLGSSLLFFALFLTMLWVATARGIYLGLGAVLFAGGAVMAWSLFSHVQTRVQIWLDPWSVAKDEGHQIVQALFAFAAGGVTGTNLAQGRPQRIPAVVTDFTFAAVGEELGLLGAAAILMTFVLVVGSGLRIAMATDVPFEKLLATGLTAIVGIQSFIILGGVTRLIPLTGITLPFVSYGGSSLLANWVLVALLIRLSDDQARRVGKEAGPNPGRVEAGMR